MYILNLADIGKSLPEKLGGNSHLPSSGSMIRK